MEYAGIAFGIIGKTEIPVLPEVLDISRDLPALMGDFGRFLEI
jgi:hypothetical protein